MKGEVFFFQLGFRVRENDSMNLKRINLFPFNVVDLFSLQRLFVVDVTKENFSFHRHNMMCMDVYVCNSVVSVSFFTMLHFGKNIFPIFSLLDFQCPKEA